MFGKDQPLIVSDKDVGDFIESLQNEAVEEIQGELDGVDSDSKSPANWPEDSDRLP